MNCIWFPARNAQVTRQLASDMSHIQITAQAPGNELRMTFGRGQAGNETIDLPREALPLSTQSPNHSKLAAGMKDRRP